MYRYVAVIISLSEYPLFIAREREREWKKGQGKEGNEGERREGVRRGKENENGRGDDSGAGCEKIG